MIEQELQALYDEGILKRAGTMRIRHTGNDKLYYIKDECMIQVDGRWRAGFVYAEWASTNTYVREKTDFEKFIYVDHFTLTGPRG